MVEVCRKQRNSVHETWPNCSIRPPRAIGCVSNGNVGWGWSHEQKIFESFFCIFDLKLFCTGFTEILPLWKAARNLQMVPITLGGTRVKMVGKTSQNLCQSPQWRTLACGTRPSPTQKFSKSRGPPRKKLENFSFVCSP